MWPWFPVPRRWPSAQHVTPAAGTSNAPAGRDAQYGRVGSWKSGSPVGHRQSDAPTIARCASIASVNEQPPTESLKAAIDCALQTGAAIQSTLQADVASFAAPSIAAHVSAVPLVALTEAERDALREDLDAAGFFSG